MTRIDNLSAIDGRILLHKLFRSLRYERQYAGITTLFILWRVCVTGSDISSYTDTKITVLHKLGLYSGTVLWLEEVVNKFYFSTIQSLVYFGAAVLLILLGINRFYDTSASIVIYGIAFEVAILILIFFIMLFTPSEDVENFSLNDSSAEEELGKELVQEIGEISKDFAITSTQLDEISSNLATIVAQQNILLESISNNIKQLSEITNPNPQMIDTMSQSNKQLAEFNENIANLINITNKLKYEEVQAVVKQELEKIFADKVSSNSN